MIVVLEGPDESGKTTLAKALLGYGLEHNFIPEYIKSPAGKLKGWDENWNLWVPMHLNNSTFSDLRVLDRTPEISEVVYAWALTRECRLTTPFESLIYWVGEVLYINCQPEGDGKTLENIHKDPFGQNIRPNLQRLAAGYDFIASVVRAYVPVVNWYRYDTTENFQDFCQIILGISEIMEQPLGLPSKSLSEYIAVGERYVG